MPRRKSSAAQPPGTESGGTAPHLRAGRAAEQLALDYLHRHGLRLVARNFNCRLGELDLVMREPGRLVFVEVRYRRDPRGITPAETITPAKQRRILRTAQHFLQRHPRWAGLQLRFDLVALSGPLGRATLRWRRGIFDAAALADQ